MKKSIIILNVLATFLLSCQEKKGSAGTEETDGNTAPKWKEPGKIAYEIKNGKQWLDSSAASTLEQELVFAVNRADRRHFLKMDSVIVPVDLSGDLVYYLPFPLKVPFLKDVDKIIFFSYATQTFGAYEKGNLIHAGPTNMGREKDPTPTGLFFTNWKAKKTISTFNDEWELRWNFNIANKTGVGWHQYELPGHPSSHSCLRLMEKDAKQLYIWADQWILADKHEVLVKGTPVIVFGSYDFYGPKPWLQLIHDPHALDLSEGVLEQAAKPFLNEILSAQRNREEHASNGDTNTALNE